MIQIHSGSTVRFAEERLETLPVFEVDFGSSNSNFTGSVATGQCSTPRGIMMKMLST
jgi:hypothetical protein